MTSSDPDSDLRAQAEARFKQTVDLEKQLTAQLQSNKSPFTPTVRALRAQIRSNYEALLTSDPSFAEAHKVELALWRLHHKRIEEFRVRIRKMAAAIAAAAAAGATAGSSSLAEAAAGAPVEGEEGDARAAKDAPPGGSAPEGRKSVAPEQLQKMLSVFRTFLGDASGFYNDLMRKLKAKHGLPADYSFSPQERAALGESRASDAELRMCQMSCHRCLIYLGDLARYKELHADGDVASRDWSVAAGYYLQAAALWPASGNPHNQMAVLATYKEDELLAVYFYYRSLAVAEPFLTARDNLVSAFEKNRQRNSQLPAVSTIQAAASRRAPTGTKKLKVPGKAPQRPAASVGESLVAFGIRFVRLNGIIFTKTSLETFGEVLAACLTEVDEVMALDDADVEATLASLHQGGVGVASSAAASGLQLMAMLIFTLHNIGWSPDGHLPSQAETVQRGALYQHAFTAVFEFAWRLIRRSVASGNATTSPLLPAVLVFLEWVASHPKLALGGQDKEAVVGARESLWRETAALLNALIEKGSLDAGGVQSLHEDLAQGPGGPANSTEGHVAAREGIADVALWEDHELRGFQPLAARQASLSYSKSNPSAHGGSPEHRRLRAKRAVSAGRLISEALAPASKGLVFDPSAARFALKGIPAEAPAPTLAPAPLAPAPKESAREAPLRAGRGGGGILPVAATAHKRLSRPSAPGGAPARSLTPSPDYAAAQGSPPDFAMVPNPARVIPTMGPQPLGPPTGPVSAPPAVPAKPDGPGAGGGSFLGALLRAPQPQDAGAAGAAWAGGQDNTHITSVDVSDQARMPIPVPIPVPVPAAAATGLGRDTLAVPPQVRVPTPGPQAPAQGAGPHALPTPGLTMAAHPGPAFGRDELLLPSLARGPAYAAREGHGMLLGNGAAPPQEADLPDTVQSTVDRVLQFLEDESLEDEQRLDGFEEILAARGGLASGDGRGEGRAFGLLEEEQEEYLEEGEEGAGGDEEDEGDDGEPEWVTEPVQRPAGGFSEFMVERPLLEMSRTAEEPGAVSQRSPSPLAQNGEQQLLLQQLLQGHKAWGPGPPGAGRPAQEDEDKEDDDEVIVFQPFGLQKAALHAPGQDLRPSPLQQPQNPRAWEAHAAASSFPSRLLHQADGAHADGGSPYVRGPTVNAAAAPTAVPVVATSGLPPPLSSTAPSLQKWLAPPAGKGGNSERGAAGHLPAAAAAAAAGSGVESGGARQVASQLPGSVGVIGQERMSSPVTAGWGFDVEGKGATLRDLLGLDGALNGYSGNYSAGAQPEVVNHGRGLGPGYTRGSPLLTDGGQAAADGNQDLLALLQAVQATRSAPLGSSMGPSGGMTATVAPPMVPLSVDYGRHGLSGPLYGASFGTYPGNQAGLGSEPGVHPLWSSHLSEQTPGPPEWSYPPPGPPFVDTSSRFGSLHLSSAPESEASAVDAGAVGVREAQFRGGYTWQQEEQLKGSQAAPGGVGTNWLDQFTHVQPQPKAVAYGGFAPPHLTGRGNLRPGLDGIGAGHVTPQQPLPQQGPGGPQQRGPWEPQDGPWANQHVPRLPVVP